MRLVKKIGIPLVIMVMMSVIMLLVVSTLTFLFRWKADKALLGIIFTYIVVGVIGGKSQKRLSETTRIKEKILEGICLSAYFIGVLVVFSFVLLEKGESFSTRFFMTGILIIGSTCLGRIL